MYDLCNVVLIVAIILVTGCGGSSDDDDSDGNNRTASQDSGGKSASEASLPKDFAADVPTYPDAKVAGVLGVPQEGYMLYLETEATPAEATEFYKKHLADNGWTIVGAVEKPESTTITATKDARNLLIGISIENDTTTISMNVPAGRP